MRNFIFLTIFSVFTAVAFNLFFLKVATAAEQGNFGRTSTATAKISLTIPPKSNHPFGFNSANLQTGFEALNIICQSNPHIHFDTPYYQLTLSETSEQWQLHTVLDAHCRGQNLEAKAPSPKVSATLIIAPY